MLYPVDLFLEYVPPQTDFIHKLAQLIEDMDDEDFRFKQMFEEKKDIDCTEYFGKGNARKGYKNKYDLYNPIESPPVYPRLKDRQRVWDAFIPFTPGQFIDLCDECWDLWMLPREGNFPKGRKHSIETCLFTTIGILKTGHSDLEMEAAAEMSHGLINTEFERNLTILDKVLEKEMYLLTDWEKGMCRGKAKSHPDLIYYLDGCDFAVRVGENKYLYKTHKKNVKHQRAMRAQILVDS